MAVVAPARRRVACANFGGWLSSVLRIIGGRYFGIVGNGRQYILDVNPQMGIRLAAPRAVGHASGQRAEGLRT